MASVWCVFHSYPYEGTDLISIHASEERADAARTSYINFLGFGDEIRIEKYLNDTSYDRVYVTEREIEE